MNHRGIDLHIIDAKEWSEKYSEQAHLLAFGTSKPKEWDRISYAMLFVDRTTDKPTGYITVQELDSETAYWQFGGAMPGTLGTAKSVWSFECGLDWASRMYKRVGFRVENDNAPMLKLGLKYGFKIIGVRMFRTNVLLEHMKEFT